MSIKPLIGVGATANDHTGVPLRTGAQRINALVSGTYVATSAQFGGATKEATITATIAAAVTDGVGVVRVPLRYDLDGSAMIPYDGTLVVFNSAVRMTREGGDDSVWDVAAYGGQNASAITGAAAGTDAVTAGAKVMEHDPGPFDTGGVEAHWRVGSDQAREMAFLAFAGAAGEPIIRFGRAGGTWASPTTPVDGDILGEIGAGAWDGTFWRRAGIMNITADGSTAAGSSPGKVVFWTTPSGSTSPVARWEVRATGDFHPIADDTYQLGTNIVRPSQVWAGTLGFISSRLAGSGNMRIRRGNGSNISAPTAIASADQLGAYIFAGHDGTAYIDTAYLKAVASENYVNGAGHGTKLTLATTLIGASAPTDRWSWLDTGDYIPAADNATDIGSSSNRIRSLYYGTSVRTSAGTQILGLRRTGWTAWTGTADRTSHNADGPATTTNLGQALKALLDDLIAHGLIGA